MTTENYIAKLKRKAKQIRSADAVLKSHHEHDGTKLPKVLGPFDLVMFGVGLIIGAGVFVLTGTAARDYAGPAVIASYAIASCAAMLSALCYAEFAAEIPMAGSAFNYVGMVYGEFLAWIAAMNLIAEYALASSTVAKGFAGYFASILKKGSLLLPCMNGNVSLDIPAVLLICFCSLILAKGIRESSTFQNVVAGVNVLTVLVVIVGASFFFEIDNVTPFVPFGIKGIFHAASIVFFSYIGFDGVATAAEEVKNPKRDLPIGIIGSLLVCTFLFMAMALGIVGMVNWENIDKLAPFSVAFDHVGKPWVGHVVSVGALTGIVTSVLMCLFAMSRILMVLGREGFLPLCLAKVNDRWHTPLNATLVTFVITALPALVLDINVLAMMVSMGTLAVLCMVCAGVITRKYRSTDASTQSKLTHDICLGVILISSICEGMFAHFMMPMWMSAALVVWGCATIWLAFTPGKVNSDKFNTPWKPFVPALGILLTMHLICSMGTTAYIRFIVWQGVGILVYVLYSVHYTKDYDQMSERLISPLDPPML